MLKAIGLTSSKDSTIRNDDDSGNLPGDINATRSGSGDSTEENKPSNQIRESTDFDEIYRTVSGRTIPRKIFSINDGSMVSASSTNPDHRPNYNQANGHDHYHDHGSYRKSKPDSKLVENSKEIGNPLLFFSRGDTQESRYASDEEEQRDRDMSRDLENLSDYHEPDGTSPEIDGIYADDEHHSNNDNSYQRHDDEEKSELQGETSMVSDNELKHGQTFSSFIPNMFRNTNNDASNLNPNANVHDHDGKTGDKFKKRFQFFRKNKKDKEKKRQSVGAPGDGDEVIDDIDKITGERAQSLIGALTVATPAISLIASCLLEDEHGISRAPLLLSLLGFRVNDISNSVSTKNRRFRLDLEYGVGPQRLKWSVERTAKDLLYLHTRFKIDNWRKEVVRNKNSELPKYPIPPLRKENNNNSNHNHNNIKLLSRQRYKNKSGTMAGTSTPTHNGQKFLNVNATTDGAISPMSAGGTISAQMSNDDILQLPDDSQDFQNHDDRHSMVSLRQLTNLRRKLSHLSLSSTEVDADQSPEFLRNKKIRNQEYINQVDNYLTELIKLVALKPQSNRLFHFFEISPISSLLSYETGYIGKQGSVHIGGTAKGQGWRVGHFKANDLKGMIDRRSEKWLLIRNSYVMYVSDINSTLPLEVFLVDSKFRISYKGDPSSKSGEDSDGADDDSDYDESSMLEQKMVDDDDFSRSRTVFKHLKIVLENSERKLSLLPKSEKEQKLWIKSLLDMKNSTVWAKKNRFDSFAPIRDNCYAQWFVDGRDYFWAISSAIEMAKDVVYIHDWWLSPEIYLRRPANGNQQWRLDRLLQRKAKQGVKIFIIIYRNVGSTVAIDSLYSKHSLLALHDENIHVIRSPNQLLQNTYFWAHHEKLCIVDHTVAFIGGIDLCYGRYDTPDHVISDDSEINFSSLEENKVPTEEAYANFQIFPGKDYSNPRVKDFHDLNKPYESMYDRNVTPRMPWHDVHMLTSGKVARDLARHFVQRWNYLLRQKRPSRFTPILTPPSDFTEEEEKKLNLGGSCEIQLLRSSGNWSLGLKQHEQSIQNAYLKLIETSEHFVYIENQFFVTSCEIDGNEIENRIGDALVDRIIRAHNEGTRWRAVIVIPLMPGFQSQVDEPDGSSVRVIMQCQYMSISRGHTSIFAKLRKYGIEPSDYIQFFSLRKWGIIGPDRTLTTEQLYIHAKIIIVDDRAALIGSANINERSMRGIRDSEMAAIVRDRETVCTKMAGEEYLAGKFAHSLRIRLMREHLGVAVDIVDIVERRFKRFEEFAETNEGLKAVTNNFKNHEYKVMSAMVETASREILNQPDGTFRWKNFINVMKTDIHPNNVPIEDLNELEANDNAPAPISLPISFNNRTGTHEANRGIRDKKKHSYDTRVQHSESHKIDVLGLGLDKYKSKLAKRARFNSGRFLKKLSQKAMKPKDTFLPDLENVMEFLESDDFEMSDEMDDESEKIIHERNKERWLLLKKIAYLQRVTSRQHENQEEENKKRAAAGLQPKNYTSRPSSSGTNTENGTAPKNGNEEIQSTINGNVNGNLNGRNGIVNNGNSNDYGSVENNKEAGFNDDEKIVSTVHPPTIEPNDISNATGNINDNTDIGTSEKVTESLSDYSEDIPIISLNENEVKSLIESINPPLVQDFNNFVDPYCFEDPLSEEFYEDLWYEHARRNTEIFRMIFHNQPDDTVNSWRDYKNFTKLQKAFVMAQEQEAKKRKDRHLFGDSNISSSESEIESELENDNDDIGMFGGENVRKKSDMANINHGKRHSINVNQFNEDIGLLGYVPPSSDLNGTTQNNHHQINQNDKEYETPSPNFVYGNDDQDNSTINLSENLNAFNNSQEPNEETIPNSVNNRTNKRRVASNFAARKRAANGERIFDRQTAERILNEIQGHLVMFPTDWLMRELEGGNWFYNTDRIPPIDIYD